MNFEELQRAWQQVPAPESGGEIDHDSLHQVRRDSRRFDRRIFWRDVREVLASFLVAGVFGKVAWSAQAEGSPAWPAWLAAVLPLGVGVFFLADRVQTRRRLAPRGDVVATELERAAAQVRHQIWLLRNVAWWYLLPLGLSAVCFALQVALYAPGSIPWWAKLLLGLWVLGPVAWFNRWIWKLNQKAVREDLQPRLDELEAQLAEFRPRGSDAPSVGDC